MIAIRDQNSCALSLQMNAKVYVVSTSSTHFCTFNCLLLTTQRFANSAALSKYMLAVPMQALNTEPVWLCFSPDRYMLVMVDLERQFGTSLPDIEFVIATSDRPMQLLTHTVVVVEESGIVQDSGVGQGKPRGHTILDENGPHDSHPPLLRFCSSPHHAEIQVRSDPLKTWSRFSLDAEHNKPGPSGPGLSCERHFGFMQKPFVCALHL